MSHLYWHRGYCALKGRSSTAFFKGFTKRSVGPLWALFKNSVTALGRRAGVCAGFGELLKEELSRPVDEAVTWFAQYKHGKASAGSLDTLRVVQILANVSQKVFSTHIFGMFEQVTKQRFGRDFEGYFRHAVGCPPFFKTSTYHGHAAVSSSEAFLVNLESGAGLSLSPLVFWDVCPRHPDTEHCYMYDSVEKEQQGAYSFKATGCTCTCIVSASNQYSPLAEVLEKHRLSDQAAEVTVLGAFRPVENE